MACDPQWPTTTVNPAASNAVSESCSTSNLPRVRLLTTARTSSPRTSSMTAAARMTLLEISLSSPFAERTCAVIPTLVATSDAPTKIASFSLAPQASSIPAPMMKGTTTPEQATSRAVPPTRISSDDLTSSPTRKSRNIAPSSDMAVRNSLGASQPRTLGPIRTPAMISPTMPGCFSRSATSAISFADTNSISMDRGILCI